jgi:hypothetical protein
MFFKGYASKIIGIDKSCKVVLLGILLYLNLFLTSFTAAFWGCRFPTENE